MLIRTVAVAALALLLPGCASVGGSTDPGTLREQVMDTERAFARTMADRDHAAFTRFLSEEAVFFEGEVPTSGKEAIATKWQPFFDGDTAPFSW
ncbi:MAG TPA: hypothetical protein VFZ18_12020, partial [Longimicrobiaceae bacterium]